MSILSGIFEGLLNSLLEFGFAFKADNLDKPRQTQPDNDSAERIRFVAIYENDDVGGGLGRIVNDANGLWGQSWFKGEWIRDDTVLNALFKPGGDVERVTDDEAAELAAALSIPFPPPEPVFSD